MKILTSRCRTIVAAIAMCTLAPVSGVSAQVYGPNWGSAYRSLAPVIVAPVGAVLPLLTVYANGQFYRGYLGPNGPVEFAPPAAAAGGLNEAEVLQSIGAGNQITTSRGASTSQFNGNATVLADSGSVRITANGSLYGSRPIPRTSDTFEATIDKDDRLHIRWAGEPRSVASITFALLDKNRRVIRETRITKMPADARFTLTSRTAYYQVYVEYVNSTTTSVVSPL